MTHEGTIVVSAALAVALIRDSVVIDNEAIRQRGVEIARARSTRCTTCTTWVADAHAPVRSLRRGVDHMHRSTREGARAAAPGCCRGQVKRLKVDGMGAGTIGSTGLRGRRVVVDEVAMVAALIALKPAEHPSVLTRIICGLFPILLLIIALLRVLVLVFILALPFVFFFAVDVRSHCRLARHERRDET